MLLAILLIVINFLITPRTVYAISPPIQTSPTDNSQVSSSRLTWETPSYPLYANDPYRIQVDDNLDFSSIYRDYKTKNTYYTPVLTEGIWYWRIKAKDSSGTWSDWSSSWSFTLVAATPSPSPSPTPTPTPSPSPKNIPVTSKKTTNTTSNTPTPSATPINSPATPEVKSKLFKPTAVPKISYQIASVAAAAASASPSTSPEVKSSKQINFFPWVGLILILAGFTALGYIYFRQKWHNT